MSRRSRRRHTLAQPDTTKAAGQVSFSPDQVLGLVNAATQVTGTIKPLPRTDPQVAFGPGVPLIPGAIDPLRPSTGRPEPRFTEYPVSSNLPGVSDRLVPWTVLRDAADRIPLFRRCIEIRKAEVSTLEWGITISKNAIEVAQQADPNASRADVENDLRERLGPQIARCTAFWGTPDRGQGYTFPEWLTQVMEEHLVLDAIALYPRNTRGGDLYSLECIDGSTIKVLRDYRGGRPLPPQPAYQQILQGFPRGEFVADADENGNVLNGYTADRLIYRRRNVRTHTLYGYSAVEQALEDGDLYLKRHLWMKSEYTDGVMPTGWLKHTGAEAWTPQQLRDYERDLNDVYSGQTAERHRFRILPPGIEPASSADVAERYKAEYDLHLIKLVASHFDVTLPELGFSEAKGLGASGWHEGQADAQDRKATQPTLRWLQAFLTDISRRYLRMPPELEFRFAGLEAEDEAAADEVAKQRVMWGRMTLNEDRDRLGLARYEFDEADKPMLMTTRGVVFLEGSSKLVEPGQIIEPGASTAPPSAPPADDEGGDEPAEDTPTPGGVQQPPVDESAKAELVAYRKWAAKRVRPPRPFRFEHLAKADAAAAGVNLAAVEFVGKAGADPKAGPRQWPGWQQDLAAAQHWAPVISRALRGAIPARRLAGDWLTARKVDAGRIADALAWIQAYGLDLVGALTSVLVGVWTDGFLIGSRSAGTLLDRRAGNVSATVDWGSWTPGDTAAAREMLGADGTGEGLAALLNNSRVTIDGIARTKYGQLAEILAAGLENGDSMDTVAGALAELVDDPQWAYMVAVTETTRASTAATLGRYRDNGVEAVEWLTAEDQRVCSICYGNEEVGPIPVGGMFPSGDDGPPGHPVCRCCLTPSTLTRDELTADDLASADL